MNTHSHAPRAGAPHVVLALALAGCCSSAFAADGFPDTPEVQLAPVTVSACGGVAVPYDQTGVSVTVLDVPELKKEGICTLSEALLTVPGTFLQPGGGLSQRGNSSNIAIRGMSGGQSTLAMMDGMRLYNPSSGMNITPNVIGKLNLYSVGKLEVLRGAQGAVYGAGARGGVIYMETPEGRGEPSLTLFNEAGSFDSYTGSAVAQGQEGALAYWLSATCERTNNDLAYADGSPVSVKHAGHYESWSEALRLDYGVDEDNKLTFTYRREDSQYRYFNPGNIYPGYSDGSRDDAFRSNLLTAKWQLRADERYSTSFMVGYYGIDSQLGQGCTYNLRNVQLEWRNRYTWNEEHETTAGFAWNRSDFRQIGGSCYDSLDNTYAVFAEHCYRPTKNWAHSLALRWDESSVYAGLPSFRAATNYHFNDEATRVFASVGSGYVTPSQLQRGGEAVYGGTRYYGNPALDCARNISVDAGVEQQLWRRHFAGATLFWSRVTDGLVSEWADDYSTCTWHNDSGHWTLQGVELTLHGSWEDGWKTGYRLACTLTQPMDSHDKQVVESSRQCWSADIHTSPLEGVTTGVGLAAASGRTDWSGGKLDAYYILRWYVHYQLNEHLSVHLRVENLTNQRFVSDSSGVSSAYYNPAGQLLNSATAVYGGCTLTF